MQSTSVTAPIAQLVERQAYTLRILRTGEQLGVRVPLGVLKEVEMAKYQVNVEVIRSYVVQVEANSSKEAVSKVESMELDEVEKDDFYVDTITDVDNEPELQE